METPDKSPMVWDSEPSEIIEGLEDVVYIVDQIIAVLEGESVSMVGVCGFSGEFRTGLARLIWEKARIEELFDVIMVEVGAFSDQDLKRNIEEGRSLIADSDENFPKLPGDKWTLIILDNVPMVLDLEKIGIPREKLRGSCKIIITSHSDGVVSKMGADKIIVLMEERARTPSEENVIVSYEVSDYYSAGCSKWKWKGSQTQKLPPRRGYVKQNIFRSLSSDMLQLLSDMLHSLSLGTSVFTIISSRDHEFSRTKTWDFHPLDIQVLQTEGIREESLSNVPKQGNILRRIVRVEHKQQDVNQKDFHSASTHRSITEEPNALPIIARYWAEQREDTRTNSNEGQAAGEISQEMVWEALPNKRDVKDCVLFCSLFPTGYEFTKDMLVWQWIAQGLMPLERDEIMEDTYVQCFDALVELECIVSSGHDYQLDQMKYTFGDKMNAFLQEQQMEPKFQKHVDGEITNMTKVEHLSLASEELDCIDFGILKQCNRLHTLMLHRCYGTKLKRLPADLFSKLSAIRNLNLSHTEIVELPSSVEYLMELRYLDLSYTPIMWLPESVCYLSNLLMLNLDGCLNLTSLPNSMGKLVNLHHLVLDAVRQLESMPTGIGKLVKLRTLRSFVVGEDDVSRIEELKEMNKLRGSFCISNLERIMTKEEAFEARLFMKRYLKTIEFQWSDIQDEKDPNEEEIIESLRPHRSIQELKIFFYSGGVLPKWISSPLFQDLISITLYRCRYYRSLLCFGELPSLRTLNILENNEVIEIDSSFCRKHVNQHLVAFPKLEKLSLDSLSKLKRWTGFEKGDLPFLQRLVIKYCAEFIGVPLLCHLNSLLHVEIRSCPKLSCLPKGGLPCTLECLMITDCPKLKERCGNKKCKDWSKVAHVPDLYIDNEKVSA